MSTTGVIVRVAIVLAFFALIYFSQRFFIRSLWRVTEKTKPAVRRVLRGLVTAAFIILIVTFLSRIFGAWWLPRGNAFRMISTLTQLWIFTSLLAFLFFGGVKLLEKVWFGAKNLVTPSQSAGPQDHDRRAFFRYSARLAATVPLVAGVYGFAAERFRFQVRQVDIPIANLPAGLDGLRIVQLSDIHSGDFMPLDEVRRAVEMANDLHADIALVTGDFISGEHDPLEGCIAELSRLRAPLGTWGCNGNHEIYARAEDRAEALFQQHGMNLLRHRQAEIAFRGAEFNLVGVDYQRDSMVAGPRPPMLDGVETLVRRDIPNILMSHNPNSFDRAAELGIELSLAGHTHGGQVRFEILDKDVTPARFITPYTAGLFHLPFGTGVSPGTNPNRHALLYVNRGLGTIALPARIGVDPEITLLTLRRA